MTKTEQLLTLIQHAGIVRAKEFTDRGFPSVYFQRLCRQGSLERISRGVYRLSHAELTLSHSLAIAAKRVPNSVVCLLSALAYHELTTSVPPHVWLAIAQKARRPTLSDLPVQFVYWTKPFMETGCDEYPIEGVTVRMTNPARTVADCFKYRHKIGLDVALEALRQALRSGGCTIDDLWRYAALCRVQTVMRPYLEALV